MIRKLLSTIKTRLLQFTQAEPFIPQKIITEMSVLAKDIQTLLSSNSGGGGRFSKEFLSEISTSAKHMELLLFHLQGKGWGSETVEKEFLSAISLLNNNQVNLCIDIGGNKGIYSDEIVRQFPHANIVIFEPALSNIQVLQGKFSENPNITIEPFAISNQTGQATLFSDEDGSGLASLTQRRLDHFDLPFNRKESVHTLCFEDYWKDKLHKQHIEICKMDIEGHELDALSGFGEALQHIDVIQFEFGGCNIDTRTFFQDFWYFFQKEDFEIYRITPFDVVKIESYQENEECFVTTNYLAKRIR